MNFRKIWKSYGTIIPVLFLHLFLLINIRFTAWPEMLLWPYLMLKDWLPYKDIAIAHTPFLLLFLKTFFGMFGIGLIQLKIFTWGLILLTDFIVFEIARKMWNRKVAFMSLIFYSALMIIYEGNGLWFDLALTPLILLTFYFVRQSKFMFAGIFGGAAFLTKQTAAWILFPVTIEILGSLRNFFERRRKGLVSIEKMIAGGSIVVAIFIIFGYFSGILEDFWAWAISFGIFYLPKAEGQAHLPALFSFLKAVIPFTALIFESNLLFWAFFGSLGVFPRWELFHIQPALPFLAFSFATLMLSPKRKWQKIPTALILSLTLLILMRHLTVNWKKETRYFEKEVLQVAGYVRENTSKSEKMLVLNSWDHFNVLTDTIPAVRPWIPQLPWYMRLPGVEEKVYNDLVLNPPNLIIFHPYSNSGLDSYKPEKIASFIERYYFVDRDFGNFIILKKR